MLEREPRSLADISALIQTMSLEKFKFLTNAFIHDKRQKKRAETLKGLQQADTRKQRTSRKMQAKYKYISRLMLYNSQLKNASTISYKGDTESMDGAGKLKCNIDWPLCLYDHTYKNRCISYFQYRVKATKDEFVDDYFEEMKIGEPGSEPEKPMAGAGLVEETKEVKTVTGASTSGPANKIYNSLLIERNKHYCTNEEFVAKINKLLEQQGSLDEAFPSTLVELATADEVSLMFVMENYINHIMTFDLDNCGHREVLVGGGAAEDAVPVEATKNATEIAKSESIPVIKVRSASIGSENDVDISPKGHKEEVKHRRAELTKTVCLGTTGGPLTENVKGLYNRRAITMSFYLADVASRMPFANSNEIIANSPSGKFLKDIVENQITL